MAFNIQRLLQPWSWKRQNAVPLDLDAHFLTEQERMDYLLDAVCYPGHVVSDLENIGHQYQVLEDKSGYIDLNDATSISFYHENTFFGGVTTVWGAINQLFLAIRYAGLAEWTPNTLYKVGDRWRYNALVCETLVAHTSGTDWTDNMVGQHDKFKVRYVENRTANYTIAANAFTLNPYVGKYSVINHTFAGNLTITSQRAPRGGEHYIRIERAHEQGVYTLVDEGGVTHVLELSPLKDGKSADTFMLFCPDDTTGIWKVQKMGGGGTAVATKAYKLVYWPAHGFTVGEVVNADYEKAIANDEEATEAIGWVVEVVDADNFYMALPGQEVDVTGRGLIAGTGYFLSTTTPGAIQEGDPFILKEVGAVSKPVLITLPGDTDAVFLPMRGFTVKNSDVQEPGTMTIAFEESLVPKGNAEIINIEGGTVVVEGTRATITFTGSGSGTIEGVSWIVPPITRIDGQSVVIDNGAGQEPQADWQGTLTPLYPTGVIFNNIALPSSGLKRADALVAKSDGTYEIITGATGSYFASPSIPASRLLVAYLNWGDAGGEVIDHSNYEPKIVLNPKTLVGNYSEVRSTWKEVKLGSGMFFAEDKINLGFTEGSGGSLMGKAIAPDNSYERRGVSHTGYISIDLPMITNNWHVLLTITVQEFIGLDPDSRDQVCTTIFKIGGGVGSDGNWYDPDALILPNAANKNLPVRFVKVSDAKWKIYIGDATTNWSHINAVVDEVLFVRGGLDVVIANWQINEETTITGAVQQTKSENLIYAKGSGLQTSDGTILTIDMTTHQPGYVLAAHPTDPLILVFLDPSTLGGGGETNTNEVSEVTVTPTSQTEANISYRTPML